LGEGFAPQQQKGRLVVSTDQPWTIMRLLDWTTSFFEGKGVESARLEAQLLLAHALGCTKMALYTRFDEAPAEEERTRFRELVQQRVKGSPVAHLLGRKEFFALEFLVSPSVLIPRPDSEWIVTECLALAKGMESPSVLDVGTGSGCLALAVASRHKGARVCATDVSEDALAVARRNAEKHKLQERVRFLQGDLFAPLAPAERFDFILSNPPYVSRAELAKLAPEVRDHEPRLAIDGGEDGFAVIDRLIAVAPDHLAAGGYLILEIGFDQEAGARQRFAKHGGYEVGKTIQDAAGHPRVLRARIKDPSPKPRGGVRQEGAVG
jgi:release factor glutamine methyltransferase